MTARQSEFRAALLGSALADPKGLQDGQGRTAAKRFSVYRNNVVVSLSEALATAFPLVRKLLGGESFARLAAVYVRAHPPTSPVMMFYGQSFPDFLSRFEPLGHIGYLADCARLDLAMRSSYHSADAAPADPALFSDAEAVLTRHFAAAPAVRVLTSDWPLYDIWRYNMARDADKPRPVAQDVIVTRPEFDPEPHVLPPGGARWLELLGQGLNLGTASDQALAADPTFDLGTVLTLMLSTSALIERSGKETQ